VVSIRLIELRPFARGDDSSDFALGERRPFVPSNRSASSNQLDYQHDERKDEQDMNESAQGVRRNNPKQPQHEKDYKDCPKHRMPPDDSFPSTITHPLTPPTVCGLFVAESTVRTPQNSKTVQLPRNRAHRAFAEFDDGVNWSELE
jgi:hypothetical protein